MAGAVNPESRELLNVFVEKAGMSVWLYNAMKRYMHLRGNVRVYDIGYDVFMLIQFAGCKSWDEFKQKRDDYR